MGIDKYKIILYVFITAVLGYSCSTKNSCYTDFQNIPNGSWQKTEPITFSLNDTILEKFDKTNIKITIRHNNEYPYHDLYLITEFVGKSGKIIKSDIKCQLANQNGKWNKSGFGSLYEYNITVKEHFNLNNFSEIKIWHNMNDSIINGISEVGITIIEDK